jgi:hypothetical protein
MKRVLLIVLFLLLAFYIGWPLFSAWQLHSAVRSGEAATLDRKIDFEAVRASLRPAVETKIAERVTQFKSQGGSAGLLLGSVLKGDMLAKVSHVVLDKIVTAENLIRLSRESGTISEKIDRLVAEQFGRISGFGGAGRGLGANAPSSVAGNGFASAGNLARQFGVNIPGVPGAGRSATSGETSPQSIGDGGAAAEASPSFGIANIKSFSMDGPLAFRVGFSRDGASASPDVTARISFKDFDWKLTGLEPHIE